MCNMYGSNSSGVLKLIYPQEQLKTVITKTTQQNCTLGIVLTAAREHTQPFVFPPEIIGSFL